ncbi:hypothetical protein Ddc_12164 [Ditylenchus destructor]|nr:hypothetical protein Ddc_12164 [Ditylenchus destructor]
MKIRLGKYSLRLPFARDKRHKFLNNEIYVDIFGFLVRKDIAQAQLSCRLFNDLCNKYIKTTHCIDSMIVEPRVVKNPWPKKLLYLAQKVALSKNHLPEIANVRINYLESSALPATLLTDSDLLRLQPKNTTVPDFVRFLHVEIERRCPSDNIMEFLEQCAPQAFRRCKLTIGYLNTALKYCEVTIGPSYISMTHKLTIEEEANLKEQYIHKLLSFFRNCSEVIFSPCSEVNCSGNLLLGPDLGQCYRVEFHGDCHGQIGLHEIFEWLNSPGQESDDIKDFTKYLSIASNNIYHLSPDLALATWKNHFLTSEKQVNQFVMTVRARGSPYTTPEPFILHNDRTQQSLSLVVYQYLACKYDEPWYRIERKIIEK